MHFKNLIITAFLFYAGAAAFLLLILHHPSRPPRLSPSLSPVSNHRVNVPAGWFRMGSETGEQDEKPAHRVWVDSFSIDRFPVTNAQYGVFVAETGHEKPLYWNDDKCNDPNQPVVGVTWADAMAYCRWLSEKEHADVTLPTEAQWEKAARSDDGRTYPWGNETPDKKRATCEITEKMPCVGMCELGKSPYGVSDLVGNVWNWCIDWYDKKYYRNMPQRNPAGPGAGTRKVVRGGNWVFLGCCSGTPAYALRSSRRNGFHPSIQKKSIGFRTVSATGSKGAAYKPELTWNKK
jgi:formylglycine-generating enzyme required for sulfatase activity